MLRPQKGLIGLTERTGVARHLKNRFLDRLAGALAHRSVALTAQELLNQPRVFGPPERLTVAPTAVINNAQFNTVSGDIEVGEWAMLAHNVYLASGEHDYTKFGEERQRTADAYGWDITVEEGAWLATNVTVLGPCRIGRHAVIAAGSLVRTDVPPYTVYAGVPARKVADIPHPEDPSTSPPRPVADPDQPSS
jgi:hypothetical protein